ncbi:hypothetical protein TOC8172_02270 [Pseudomonas syringae]
MKVTSALKKNTFALGPASGPLKKDVKGQVAKNNNRPPEKQKKSIETYLEGEPRLPFVLSDVCFCLLNFPRPCANAPD